MSHLTQLKQRIKTVATLQKTTHAMRLTSMSMHARLHKKKEALELYKNTLNKLLHEVAQPSTTLVETTSRESENVPELVIVVGSQKGLCGIFNTRLLNLYEQTYKNNTAPRDVITIGKKITEYFEQHRHQTMSNYNDFTAHNFIAIAHEVIALINASPIYQKITIFSNSPRTFFVQESHVAHLTIPQRSPSNLIPKKKFADECITEEPLPDLIYHLTQLLLKAHFEELLFKSLLAEQAARFVSMDSSTRNAEELLSDMKRNYNKLRQDLITRELTDLAGGML